MSERKKTSVKTPEIKAATTPFISNPGMPSYGTAFAPHHVAADQTTAMIASLVCNFK